MFDTLLRKGDEFPTKDDFKRMQQYKDLTDLFENKQLDVLLRKIDDVPYFTKERKEELQNELELIYIQIPLPMEMARLISDLLFRKEVNFDVVNDKTQKIVNEIKTLNKLRTLLCEGSVDCANKGGIVFKTYLKNGMAAIKIIQPDYYFPEFVPGDRQEIIRERVSWTFEDGENENNKKWYRYIETHEFNTTTNTYWIYYQLFEQKDGEGKLGNEKKVSEFFSNIKKVNEDTKMEVSPLTYIPLWRANGNYFGYSIHYGLQPLYDVINNRISQLDKLFDKYSDPTMSGPQLDDEDEDHNYVAQTLTEKVLGKAPGTNPNKITGKYIPREKEDAEVKYHTWPAEVESTLKFIKEVLMEMLYIVSPINPTLYGLDKSSSNISGRAIRLKSFRADCTIDRISNYWLDGLENVIYKAQVWLTNWNKENFTPEIPKVVWKNGFPVDEKEEAEYEKTRIDSANTTTVDSIMRLDGATKEQAQDKYKEILEEEKDKNPAGPNMNIDNPFKSNRGEDE